MKKIILICTFLLFGLLTISTRAQTITVGSGTSTSYLIPVNSNYGYTYSQQIILQSEIATTGNIEKIKFLLFFNKFLLTFASLTFNIYSYGN